MDISGTKHEPQISPARLLRRSHLLGDFLTVIAEGSIRQAADKIAISQSALTRRIQDLEEGLGANLFERTSRGMTLTPFGEVLKHHAQLVAITCQYAVSEISELLEGEAGELRISAGPAWAYALGAQALYRGVFGGVDLRPAFNFRHDVKGWAYDQSINEGSKTLALSLDALFGRYTFNTTLVKREGGVYQPLRDRSHLQMSLSARF